MKYATTKFGSSLGLLAIQLGRSPPDEAGSEIGTPILGHCCVGDALACCLVLRGRIGSLAQKGEGER